MARAVPLLPLSPSFGDASATQKRRQESRSDAVFALFFSLSHCYGRGKRRRRRRNFCLLLLRSELPAVTPHFGGTWKRRGGRVEPRRDTDVFQQRKKRDQRSETRDRVGCSQTDKGLKIALATVTVAASLEICDTVEWSTSLQKIKHLQNFLLAWRKR